MATASSNTIVTAAIKLLQRLGFNSDVPITAMLDDGLVFLQDMVENLNLSSGMWIGLSSVTFTPTANTINYTIGAAQTINIARPPKIVAATALNLGNQQPLFVVQDIRQWTAQDDPTRTTKAVTKVFYDRGNPTGNIYLSPSPGAAPTGTITLWYPQRQTNFADKTTAIEILPGYLRLLKFALAMEFCTTYSLAPTATVANAYKQALDDVITLNAELFGPTDRVPMLGTERSA